jgi:HD superfamily phosphohydrolase
MQSEIKDEIKGEIKREIKGEIHQSMIRDPIYGDVLIPPDVRSLIDTRSFQRLRYIQQLATCHFAFPSATHTRFAHSVGAFHLAGQLTAHLQRLYPGVISDLDAKLVTYGALLHDVGHPPLSHMLETPEVFATYASHESWGKRLLLDPEGDLRGAVTREVGEEGLERLVAILEGRVSLPALHEIISSQLDVDRLDYLIRDQRFTGVETGGLDITRLFRAIRLSEEGRLAVGRDGLPIVESYLVMRWHMYYMVYFHRVSVLTQLYIIKALKRARSLAERGELTLSSALHDILLNEALTPQQYRALTDLPVMSALFEWVNHPDPKLSELTRRLSARSELHRRITGHPLNISAARRVMPALKQLIVSLGYDPDDDLLLARTQKRGYFPYQEGILTEEGDDVRERSRLIKALESKIDEVMIFVPPACVTPCVALINEHLNA